jgi:hypothetical protein
MKHKLISLAAMLAIAASMPSCKHAPTSAHSLRNPGNERGPLLPAENGENSPVSGKYFSSDNNSSLFIKSGRLLAQNKNASKSKKAKKTTKKSSLLPGQFPESSERLITEKDVEHQTPWGMKVMLNEIYARQGYIFKDADLRKHFAKEKWYKGKERSLNKIKLTRMEVQNIEFIKNYQKNAKV